MKDPLDLTNELLHFINSGTYGLHVAAFMGAALLACVLAGCWRGVLPVLCIAIASELVQFYKLGTAEWSDLFELLQNLFGCLLGVGLFVLFKRLFLKIKAGYAKR